MTFIQNKFLKYYIGYDKIFENFEKISTVTPQINIAFNILKYDYNRYQITVALAGVSPDEVCINVSNDLLILDVKEKKKSIQNDFIHKGIRPNIIHQVFQLEQNISELIINVNTSHQNNRNVLNFQGIQHLFV